MIKSSECLANVFEDARMIAEDFKFEFAVATESNGVSVFFFTKGSLFEYDNVCECEINIEGFYETKNNKYETHTHINRSKNPFNITTKMLDSLLAISTDCDIYCKAKLEELKGE